jgi:hypothetical protein
VEAAIHAVRRTTIFIRTSPYHNGGLVFAFVAAGG